MAGFKQHERAPSNHIIVHLARINDRASSGYKEAGKVIRALTPCHHPDEEARARRKQRNGIRIQQENHGVLKKRRRRHGVKNLSDSVIRILFVYGAGGNGISLSRHRGIGKKKS